MGVQKRPKLTSSCGHTKFTPASARQRREEVDREWQERWRHSNDGNPTPVLQTVVRRDITEGPRRIWPTRGRTKNEKPNQTKLKDPLV